MSESRKEELDLDSFETEWQTKPDFSDTAVQTHGEATAAETTGIYNFQKLLLLDFVDPLGMCIL